MPNWCNNVVEVSHPNPRKIAGLRRAFRQGKMLSYIKPVPKHLVETMSGWTNDPYEQELLAFRQQLNIKYYGFKDWYDWSVANWSTKWDCGERGGDTRVDSNNLTLSFDTAWSPPVGIYETMLKQGYTVKAFYYEGGMAFAGIWDDGADESYQDWGDSVGAKLTLPQELDEMFAISESMAEWEEEERREEELYTFVKDGVEERSKVSKGMVDEEV